MERPLFSQGNLSDALVAQVGELQRDIDGVPADHVIHADEKAWIAALVERYRVNVPRLDDAGIWMEEPSDVDLDVSRDPDRYFSPGVAPTIRGTRIVVHIPFEGDAVVLRLRPDHFDFNAPRASIGNDELLQTIEFPADAHIDIRAQVDDLTSRVDRYLAWARNQADAFNAQLEHEARTRIEMRRAQAVQTRQQITSSGIPVGRPDARAKTYIADAIVTRPTPLSRREPSKDSIRLVPVLGDEIFEHVLDVIRAALAQMERTPDAYRKLGEQQRRDVLLTALNSHYVGQASGEAFNAGGRTDILVRWENRNVFIGECKFWSGAKAFAETIDQLFRYTTWRDTKLALILFVREKRFTEIVATARRALEGHRQFKAWKPTAPETELRAAVRWPGDPDREADLAVLLVQTP